MNENVLYFKRPFFSSINSIIKRLSVNLNVKRNHSSSNKCIILENSEMVVAIRKDMIDIVLLTECDVKTKKTIYDLAEKCI